MVVCRNKRSENTLACLVQEMCAGSATYHNIQKGDERDGEGGEEREGEGRRRKEREGDIKRESERAVQTQHKQQPQSRTFHQQSKICRVLWARVES